MVDLKKMIATPLGWVITIIISSLLMEPRAREHTLPTSIYKL
jgi:hypothetical protein